MSVVVVRMSGVSRNQPGVTGRYQAKCGHGLCALTGDQATSKLQGELFTLLDYVIGGGDQDVRVGMGGRALRIDMVFSLPRGLKLAVEYDGAYWHHGQDERDFRKARAIEDYYWPCMSMRVREYPLEPTRHEDFVSPDVQVPARADARTCARLVLFHLTHLMPAEFGNRWSEAGDRVASFLRSASRPLERGSVLCETCWHVACRYLPVEDSSGIGT
jgi:hypothetical protein